MTPLASKVLDFLKANGSITAQEAMLHLDGTNSGSLTRRITELQDADVPLYKEMRVNPITKRKYTRYHLLRSSTPLSPAS